jgi:hypothetical protein
MLRLYMDVHVKAAIITGVRRREIDVVTAQEDGTTRLDDTVVRPCYGTRTCAFQSG